MKTCTVLFFTVLFLQLSAQVDKYAYTYVCTKGKIHFFSGTMVEDIEANSNSGVCVLNTQTKRVNAIVKHSTFALKDKLMQEHFNENYVESDKYPKSTYKGKITNFSDVDLSRDGSYPVKISGKLTIHGETKEIPSKGTFVVKDGKVSGMASFTITLSDFDIEIPDVVKDKISETVNIHVAVWLDPLP